MFIPSYTVALICKTTGDWVHMIVLQIFLVDDGAGNQPGTIIFLHCGFLNTWAHRIIVYTEVSGQSDLMDQEEKPHGNIHFVGYCWSDLFILSRNLETDSSLHGATRELFKVV